MKSLLHLLALCALLTPPRAAAQVAAPSLPWRHADERLTLGLNPSLAVFRADPADAPPEPLNEEERTLVTLLRENPGNAAAQIRLAGLELRKGLRARAADRYLGVARVDGANAEALSGLAVCLLADQSFDPAIKLLEEMKRKGLASDLDQFNLAWAYLRREKAELAAEEMGALRKRLERAPRPDRKLLATVSFNLAGIALARSRADEAREYLQQVRKWESAER